LLQNRGQTPITPKSGTDPDYARTRTAMKTLFAELENYAGSELEADYS
jgi:hypothetical protein